MEAMNIPFIDFKEQYKEIKDEVDAGLAQLFETGGFILGKEEKTFEEEFAKYCQCTHGVGVNSGTDALHLALRAIGIGPGDEVILPTFTFIATALAVSYTGAKPVLVDIQEDSHNIDPEKLEEAITEKTKAIIAVHLYGQAADIEEIKKIIKDKNIRIVEDAAQAHGSIYHNQRVGSLGDIACFSFYPTKGLGAFGDGGMITTGNQDFAKKAQMLRDYGREGRYEHILKGYNSRLDTVQAVILSAKLKRLDQWNKMRGSVASQYIEQLAEVDAIKTPTTKDNRTHTYQTFAVGIPRREELMEKLKTRQISSLIHYPIPIHLQEAYKDLGYKKGDFPVSEKFADEQLSLPMFPHMNKEQVTYVVSALKELTKNG